MDIIEILGFVFAVVGIYYSTQRKIIYWPLSIISSLAYLFFFYKIGLYADSLLQVFFIVSSIYAWVAWKKNIQTNKKLHIIKASNIYLLKFIIFTLVLGIGVGICFDRYTDASLPYLDSILFAFSILATYLSARAILQNWILWIIINAFYIVMYITKQAYITSILYFVLIIIAIIGYLNWKKSEQAELN